MMRARLYALLQIAAMFLVCGLAWRYGPAHAPVPAATDIATRLAFLAQ